MHLHICTITYYAFAKNLAFYVELLVHTIYYNTLKTAYIL